jgi:hypothetical protein
VQWYTETSEELRKDSQHQITDNGHLVKAVNVHGCNKTFDIIQQSHLRRDLPAPTLEVIYGLQINSVVGIRTLGDSIGFYSPK